MCFHFSPLIFTTAFSCFHCWLHLFTILLYPDCFLDAFLRCFIFVLLYSKSYRFERTFLLSGVFYLTLLPTFSTVLQVLGFKRALIIVRVFFYLTQLPDIWHNLLLSRLPWELAVLPWRLQGLPLRFQTLILPICLFEPHSAKQKVLLESNHLIQNLL